MMDLERQVFSDASFIHHRSPLNIERMCRMRFVVTTLALAFVLGLAGVARAQDPALVNEIVARVNNDIITLTDYQGAIEAFKEELRRQMQGKSEAEFTAEFEKLRPTVLDLMIED